MKPKYWAIIILALIAAIVCWYYFAINNQPVYECFSASSINKIKDLPKPNNGECPAGYFLNAYYCPKSPTWCEPIKNATSSAKSGTDIKDWNIYSNAEYGFEVKYPNNWRSPAEVMPGNSELNKNNIFFADDPNRQPGEPGSSFAPAFGVRLYNNVSEIPPIEEYLQTTPEEITTTNKTVKVDGQTSTEKDYKSFAVEGAYDVTYLVQLSKNNKIYILEFSYTLAGCSVIPKDMQPECDNENALLVKNSNQIWSQILSSFKFIPPVQSQIDTSGWKTYTNSQYGFEFNYPGKLLYKETSSSNKLGPNFTLEFGSTQGRDENFTMYINNPGIGFEGFDDLGKKDLIINNIKMQKHIYGDAPSKITGIITYEFSKDGNEFLFVGNAEIIKETDFDQILSTFKFTK